MDSCWYARSWHDRGYISSQVRLVEVGPRNVEELRRAVHHAWQTVTQARIRRLVRSCSRRVTAVINAHGGPTRY